MTKTKPPFFQEKNWRLTGLWVLGVMLIILSAARMMVGVGLIELMESRVLSVLLIILTFQLFRPRDFRGFQWQNFYSPFLLPGVFVVIWFCLVVAYGEINIEALVSTSLQTQNAGGILKIILWDIRKELLIGSAFLLGCILTTGTDNRLNALRWKLLPLLILINPLTYEIGRSIQKQYFGPLVSLAEMYHPPVIISKPAQKLNVIHILLEATEKTLDEVAPTAEVMQPLTSLRNRAVEFRGLEQIDYTGWSIAGNIASNCGVPLITKGLNTITSWGRSGAKVLQGALCLPEILEAEGYLNTFIFSVELSFAGNEFYTRDNGWQTQVTRSDFEKMGYVVRPGKWGIDDEHLLDVAFKKAVELDKLTKPFLLTISPVGAHPPSGFTSLKCLQRESVMKFSDNSFLQSYRCLNELVAEFIEKLDAAGITKNTLIVVQSDHLAATPRIVNYFKGKKRTNLFFVITPKNTPSVINKSGSMLDIYPTVVELLGYKLKESRANLGTSLLSDEDTLVQLLGLKVLNSSLHKDKALRAKMWGVDEK